MHMACSTGTMSVTWEMASFFFSFTNLLACSYTVKQLLSLNRYSNDVASYSFILEVVDN